MRIIFAGTPDFAAHSLSSLLSAGHDVICVYTQPDRKTGRGQKLTYSPVKNVALNHNIEIRQPRSLKEDDEYQYLKDLNPDVVVVVAYGMLLPQRILDTPKIACLNIHASLLPRWRGAAPIQRAIEAGDLETGVGIMLMEAGLDTGPVLFEAKLNIEKTDTSASLHDKLATLGAESLLQSLTSLSDLLANAKPQDHDKACYAHKITKAEAQIDWNKSARELEQRIRAFNPWPVCQTNCNGQRIRIWQAELSIKQSDEPVGTILTIDKNGIHVNSGDGVINLQIVQRDGSKPMPVKDFINSSDIKVGDCFDGI